VTWENVTLMPEEGVYSMQAEILTTGISMVNSTVLQITPSRRCEI